MDISASIQCLRNFAPLTLDCTGAIMLVQIQTIHVVGIHCHLKHFLIQRHAQSIENGFGIVGLLSAFQLVEENPKKNVDTVGIVNIV